MQLSFDDKLVSSAKDYDFGTRSDGGTHGVVLTKPHIVSLILDLCGYDPKLPLGQKRILEPSCGEGAFLAQIVDRLLASARAHGDKESKLADAILAFDIEPVHVQRTRELVQSLLVRRRVRPAVARQLAERWVVCGDFLLDRRPGAFDFVVGNPPYVRIEQIEPVLQRAYRQRYATIFDRADLYIAFIENGLSLLTDSGRLGYVCADRWTLNRYGEPLRKLISANYSVEAFVDLHQASPFESEVIAYPSIFVIGRGPQRSDVPVAKMEAATPSECAEVSKAITASTGAIARYDSWFKAGEPWVMSSPQNLSVLRSLEASFPLLEESGARVRIGVATGCDSVFIVPSTENIEADRLVPLVKREDIEEGAIRDAGISVINTFSENGLLDLDAYPRLAAYLQTHSEKLKRRHVAKQSRSWFRTIDRVYPELVSTPKLLIPDIAGSNEVVLDSGRFFPHHNLYYILSENWDLEVLGALLSSKVALFFVWSYAVKMRGGYLRFQAQYLRKIRVPRPESIPKRVANALARAFRARDFEEIDRRALEAFGLKSLPSFEFVDTRR
jgi:adenine-specific DNA-methyltransferase